MKKAVLIFYVAAFLLNAPALQTSAENLPFDHPLRQPLLTLLAPFSTFSTHTHLSTLRTTITHFERQTLE